MNLSLGDVGVLLLFAGLVALLWQHGNISRRAYLAVRQYTREQGVTLLDQSVVLKSVGVCRSSHSLLALERRYDFEFSSVGDVRYPGRVIFRGGRQVHIELAPFKTVEQPDPVEYHP